MTTVSICLALGNAARGAADCGQTKLAQDMWALAEYWAKVIATGENQ